MIAAFTIVKNESDVIERCLSSTAGFVDLHIVIDTGSIDDTIKKACRFPLAKVLEEPWKDFGSNLTDAVSRTSEYADWMLRLDADMTIEYHPNFVDWLESSASADAYNVNVHDGSLTYRLPLLMNSFSGPWRYVGKTHEYLDAEGRSVADLMGLDVHHFADGGTRTEKHERDIALLIEDAENGNPRSTYYLAQAYECLDQNDKAIEWFDRRASLGGWEEERWHAAYKAASLRQDPHLLIEIWKKRPWRPEPLEAARKLVAEKSRHNDRLFLESQAWNG